MGVAVDDKRDKFRETLRSLMLTAWQQRWSQHTWTTAIKQALPCGVSGDSYDLATLILELASGTDHSSSALLAGGCGGGVTLSPLLLMYLRRALCVELISVSSTLIALTRTVKLPPSLDPSAGVAEPGFSAPFDWVQLGAVLGLLQHVLSVPVPCRGPAPNARQLASSLHVLLHWLCRLVASVTSAMAAGKRSRSVDRMDMDGDVLDDDDDDDGEDYDEAACDKSVALLVSVVASLAGDPFLLCLIYLSRMVDGCGGDSDLVCVDSGDGSKGLSVVDEQTLSDMLKRLVIPPGVATSRELQLRAIIGDLQRVLNFRPERDLSPGRNIATSPPAICAETDAVTPAPAISPPSSAPGSVPDDTLSTNAPSSDQSAGIKPTSSAPRSETVWAASDRLVSSLLVVEVMCRRASPVHQLATRLLCAARLRCWPDDSPAANPPSASAADSSDEDCTPLLLLAIVHSVLRTCFQCLVVSHDSPLARYWLQFTLLRVPRLLAALCRLARVATTANSSGGGGGGVARGKARSGDAVPCENMADSDAALPVDCVPVVKAALLRLIDSSALLLDRADILYTGDAVDTSTNMNTADAQSSPSQQQQQQHQQDCLQLLMGQLVKNRCLNDSATVSIKQYRQTAQQQQQQLMTSPIITSSNVAPPSASTDSPASVLRAEPTVNSILSTMQVQQRQCEQYGASSKFSTVLLHLLGPSQHLVMGAAVAVGLVQRLTRHLLALNQLCSRALATTATVSGGSDSSSTSTVTLKNQALVFEISFLIVVTTVKNYGRQALPVSIGTGGTTPDSGPAFSGSSTDPGQSGSFLLDWIDEYCDEHGISVRSRSGSSATSSQLPADDPVQGQLQLLIQLLLSPGASVLQPSMHWQLLCGRAMPLFVQRLLASWSAGFVNDGQVGNLVDAVCGQYTCIAVCLFASVLAATPHLPDKLARAAVNLLKQLLTAMLVSPSSGGGSNDSTGGSVGEHMSERLTLAHDIMRHLLELNRHRISETLLGHLAVPAVEEPEEPLLCDRSGSQGSGHVAPMLFLHSDCALRVCRLLQSRGADWLVGALLRRQLETSPGSAGERGSALDHALAVFSVEPVPCAVAILRYMIRLLAGGVETSKYSSHSHPHHPQQQQHRSWSDSQLHWLASLAVGCVLVCVADSSQPKHDSQSQSSHSDMYQHSHYRYLSLRLWYHQQRYSQLSPSHTSSASGELSVPIWSVSASSDSCSLPEPLLAVLQLLSEQMAAAVFRSSAVSSAVRLSIHYIHESLLQAAGDRDSVGYLLTGCSVATISRLIAAEPHSFTSQQLVQLLAEAEPAAAELAAQLLCEHRALLVDAGVVPKAQSDGDDRAV